MNEEEMIKWINYSLKELERRSISSEERGVFCVAPFDLTIKMRRDLSEKLSITFPRFTMSIELSALNISIDNEMWSDLMALSDLTSWHRTSCPLPEERPQYRQTVSSCPKKYWQYAYKSVVRLIREKNRDNDINFQYKVS